MKHLCVHTSGNYLARHDLGQQQSDVWNWVVTNVEQARQQNLGEHIQGQCLILENGQTHLCKATKIKTGDHFTTLKLSDYLLMFIYLYL